MSDQEETEAEATGSTTTSPTSPPPVVIDPWPVPRPVPPVNGWDNLVVI